MAKNIKLSPEELLAQGAEMSSLQNEFNALFRQVTNSLNGIDSSVSPNMARNFASLIQGAQKPFSSIENMLGNGSAAARLFSATFTSGTTAEKILSGLLGGGDGSFSSGVWSGLSEILQGAGTGLDGKSGSWITEMLGMGFSPDAISKAAGGILNGDLSSALQASAAGLDLGTLSQIAEGAAEGGSLLESIGTGCLKLEEGVFFKNWAFGTLESAGKIVADMYSDNPDPGKELKLLGEMAWNFGPGAVLKTSGDAAWNIAKEIPFVGDYYESKGATDAESALGVMLGDVAYAITGNQEDADYIGNYYSNHGGIASGIVDGVVDIGSYVWDNAAPALENAWHSVVNVFK